MGRRYPVTDWAVFFILALCGLISIASALYSGCVAGDDLREERARWQR